MKKLFRVTCAGNNAMGRITERDSIYVVSETESDAASKALNKMRELKNDKIDSFVSKVELIGDEKESNNCILIL